MNRKVTLIALAMMTVSALPAAAAQPVVRVEFKDLDLGSEQGARVAKLRIEAAAVAICGSTDYLMPLAMLQPRLACKEEVKAKVLASTPSPSLAKAVDAPAVRVVAQR